MQPNERKRVMKLAWIVVIYQVFGSYALIIIQNYGNYVMTNVAGLTPALAATVMSISSMFLVIWSLFNGAIVQKTRSRWGQFRPWYMFGIYVCVGSGYLMYLKFGNAVILTAVVVAIGYILPNALMDLLYTARQGMFMQMAQGNGEANVIFGSYNWIGTYIGYFIAGATTVPLVNFFGKGSEALGFIGAHTVYGISCFIGYAILVKAAKPYDLPNKDAEIAVEKRASLVDMVKGVITNKAGVVVILADIGRFTGYYALMNLIAFQCTYVIGDLNASATVFSITNLGGLAGSYIATILSNKVGRKMAIRISDVGSVIMLLGIIPFGKTVIGLTAIITIYQTISSIADGVDPALYIDAGQYSLYLKGKDTRSYFNSMYNVAVKASLGLAGIISNGVLAAMNYDADMVLDAAGKAHMSMLVGGACAACYLVPVIVMFFHPMSDAQADEYAAKNLAAEKAALGATEAAE